MPKNLKNSDKGKWMYSGFGIALDGAGSWNFGNGYSRNVVIFVLIIVVHLILTDNLKNYFFVLSEGQTSGLVILNFFSGEPKLPLIMKALVHQKKSLILVLVMKILNFASVCIIMW